MVTASGPEMLALANSYLAQTAKDQDMTHAAQLHLVLVSDLCSDEVSMH